MGRKDKTHKKSFKDISAQGYDLLIQLEGYFAGGNFYQTHLKAKSIMSLPDISDEIKKKAQELIRRSNIDIKSILIGLAVAGFLLIVSLVVEY